MIIYHFKYFNILLEAL